MRSKSEVRLLSLGLAYVLLMPIAISIFVGWHDLPTLARRLWTEQAAGWAQMVGSIGAIFVAVWVDRGSARRALAERKDELARQLGVIVSAAHLTQIIEVAEAGIAAGAPRASADHFESAREFIAQFRAPDMPSGPLAFAFGNLRRAIGFYADAYDLTYDALASRSPVPAIILSQRQEQAAEVAGACDLIMAEVMRIARENEIPIEGD